MRAKTLHHFAHPLAAAIYVLVGLAIASSISLAAANPATKQAVADAPLPPTQPQVYLPLLTNGPPSSESSTTPKLSTPRLIKQAFARGEITADEQALYLAYALYDPQSLPQQFRSNVGWYGTQFVAEVQNHLQSVHSASTNRVQQELSRMELLAATVCDIEDGANSSNSTNFHFNYDTIGGGLTLNDYKTSMETTFTVEVTQFGWAKPPLCGATCDNANPFGRYPIQISNLGGGLYGYVTSGSGGQYTGLVGDNPNTPATETAALASCMVLNDDFSQFPEGAQGALDSTTSHEFVHAIQNGYGDPDPREDTMWYESAAAYMEDEIFNDANSDYQYLWPVVSNSLGEWPRNAEPGGVSQYSNFLFFRYVAEQNGGAHVVNGGENVMQRFWENVGAGQAALIAYNNALGTVGTNLPDAFHNYAIAAKFEKGCTGGYAGSYCLVEGPDYTAFVGSLPPTQGAIAANPGTYNGSIQNHYAANWLSLPTSGSPYQVTLNNTATGGQLRGSLVCDTGSTLTVVPFPTVVGAGNVTTINSFDASGCNSVVAVITNQEQLSGNPSSTTAHSYSVAVSAATSTPTPTSTATTTPTATPTATSVSLTTTPTATHTNTPTATPIDTPVPPTNTPTATPTNTPPPPTSTPPGTNLTQQLFLPIVTR